MFDDPKPDDIVQGYNSTCTIKEFNEMTPEQREIFVYGEVKTGISRGV